MVRFAEFLLIFAAIALAIMAFALLHRILAAGLAVLAAILWGSCFRRIRRAHFRWDANLLSIFGLPVFSYLLLRSRLSHRRNKIVWKGRSYPTAGRGSPAGDFDRFRAGTSRERSAGIVQH